MWLAVFSWYSCHFQNDNESLECLLVPKEYIVLLCVQRVIYSCCKQ